MGGIDLFQALGGQYRRKIFSADSINTVPGQSFSTLIDKETISIQRFGVDTVFSDVEFDELGGLWPEFYLSIAICLAQNGQGPLLGIEVVDLKHCYFTGPGTRVIE